MSAEVSVLHVQGDSAAHMSQNAYAGRIGVKERLFPWMSVTGGAGAGGSAAGGFVAPDVGAIIAYENPYIVPFLALRGTLSQPIGASLVDTSSTSNSRGEYVFTPHLTWIGGGIAGIRVPLGSNEAKGTLRGALLGGIGFTHLADENDAVSVISALGGGEIIF